MGKNKPVWLTVAVIIVTSIFLITIHLTNPLHSNNTPSYINEVNRAINSPSEEQALKVAETINYATITRFERYNTKDIDEYKHPGTYIPYTWAHFIDTEVIDYYQTRTNYYHSKLNGPSVAFTYDANITYLEQLRISDFTESRQSRGSFRMEDGTFQEKTTTYDITYIGLYNTDKSIPFKTVSWIWHTFYKNQTTFHKMSSDYNVIEHNLTFNNCYIVEMNLSYTERYGPLAAFFVNVNQLVVLDQNFEPIWIGISPPSHVVS